MGEIAGSKYDAAQQSSAAADEGAKRGKKLALAELEPRLKAIEKKTESIAETLNFLERIITEVFITIRGMRRELKGKNEKGEVSIRRQKS